MNRRGIWLCRPHLSSTAARAFHVKSSALSEVAELDLALLGTRYGLVESQLMQLSALLGCLSGSELAPTSVRDAERAVHTHLADSLVALELDVVHAGHRIADLGAGAGFPGLVLAVAMPASEVALVESNRRKCAFIESVCRVAAIGNARVVCVRGEEWQGGVGIHDLVLARALAPQPVVLEYAAPLLSRGGVLVDWRGRRDSTSEAAAGVAAGELGLRLLDICHVQPYPGAREHHLHTYRKIADTPDRFPRRVGVARKRPLGC
jgi:16S rRNA (guanine527-N7)-methyltransferase